MTDRELLEQLLQKVGSIETNMATKQELSEIKQTVTKMENIMATKNDISHLEEKIDVLAAITQDDVVGMLTHVKAATEQIDERMESIEDDLNYLAKKSVKYGSEIGKLKKTYKKHL